MTKRWDAFWEMGWASVRISRLVKGYLPRHPSSSEWAGETSEPAIDIWEHSGEYVVEAELPGVDRESLTISVTGSSLVIEGFKNRPQAAGCLRFLCLEREYGYFRRVMELPSPVDRAGVSASIRDGVLVIRFPVVRERRRRQVSIPVSDVLEDLD